MIVQTTSDTDTKDGDTHARSQVEGRPLVATPGVVCFAMAPMASPGSNVRELCEELGIPRQTPYWHVSPTGAIRADGTRVCNRNPGEVDLPTLCRARGGRRSGLLRG